LKWGGGGETGEGRKRAGKKGGGDTEEGGPRAKLTGSVGKFRACIPRKKKKKPCGKKKSLERHVILEGRGSDDGREKKQGHPVARGKEAKKMKGWTSRSREKGRTE